MSLLAYGLVALAVLGALGGIAYKLDHNGLERGRGEIQVKWDADVAARKADSEKERARVDAIRATQDAAQTKRLANEKKRAAGLMVSLDAHIKVAGLRADCRITPQLLDDANSAISAGQSVGPGTVPSKPGAVTPAR